MAVSMYYIFEQRRRVAIDIDLEDYADFLTAGLGGETTDLSDIFDKMLPKARMKEEIHQELEIEKARNVLEDEAEQIRKKLEALSASYQ